MNTLFQLAIFALPINGIRAFGVLGEFDSETSIYIFLPLLVIATLSVSKSPFKIPWHLQVIMALLLSSIAVSFFVNLDQIAASNLKGRTGLGRAATTVAVPIVMVLISSFSSHIMTSAAEVERLFMRPLAYAVFLCGLVWVPEFGQHFVPALEPINDVINAAFRGNGLTDPENFRSHSICFEPPSLSYLMALAFPWMLGGFRIAGHVHGDRRTFYLAAMIVSLVLLSAALSRTGMVMIAGTIALEMLYIAARATDKEYLHKIYIGAFSTCFLIAAALICFVYFNLISYNVSVGESVSNISRLAQSIGAIEVLKNNPIFGVGFGQAAFSTMQYLPNWAWISYEINGWYTDPEFYWPPFFNIYLRLGAETGIVGLIIWCAYWVSQMGSVFMKSLRTQSEDLPAAEVLRCIEHTIFAFLLSGLSFDSFRSFILWIAIGLINIKVQAADQHIADEPIPSQHRLTAQLSSEVA